MQGHEVNALHHPKNRVKEDEGASAQYLSIKLNFFRMAYHNMECAQRDDSGDSSPIYGFIPFPCGIFVDMLIEASIFFQCDRTKKFLDIGCGMGSKVMLASVAFEAHGIEISEEQIVLAQRLGQKNVVSADALTYEHYGEFDLLYYYRPFRVPELQVQLEDRIYRQMKPGALVAPMHVGRSWDLPGMKQVGNYIYEKTK